MLFYPAALPLCGQALVAGFHLRFDAVAVAYRRAMLNLAVAASAPIEVSAE
jgi:hypothetical protein